MPRTVRRSPCGERGLKSGPGLARKFRAASLPVRGAWIEITIYARRKARKSSRSPCGERGLKSFAAALVRRRPSSLPVRGAWIEIISQIYLTLRGLSLPVRGAWIEISCSGGVTVRRMGRSPCGERGLKYDPSTACWGNIAVAPRAGSVD